MTIVIKDDNCRKIVELNIYYRRSCNVIQVEFNNYNFIRLIDDRVGNKTLLEEFKSKLLSLKHLLKDDKVLELLHTSEDPQTYLVDSITKIVQKCTEKLDLTIEQE